MISVPPFVPSARLVGVGEVPAAVVPGRRNIVGKEWPAHEGHRLALGLPVDSGKNPGKPPRMKGRLMALLEVVRLIDRFIRGHTIVKAVDNRLEARHVLLDPVVRGG